MGIAVGSREYLREVAVLRKEARMLAFFQHPHIVGFSGVVLDAGTGFAKYIMMERAAFNLSGYLRSLGGRKLSLQAFTGLCSDVLRGLACMHAHHTLHRDIKHDNILIFVNPSDGSATAKLGDIGEARFASTVHLTRGVGTPAYRAPEVLDDSGYTELADVYSFGVMMAEVACNHVLTLPEGRIELSVAKRKDVCARAVTGLRELGQEVLSNLIHRAVMDDPGRRLSAVDILAPVRPGQAVARVSCCDHNGLVGMGR